MKGIGVCSDVVDVIDNFNCIYCCCF